MPNHGVIEVHTGFRFVVEIKDISFAAFTECNLPTLQVETQTLNEGGLNGFVHTLPIRVKAGNVTLKHGVTRDARLLRWYFQVLEGNMADAMRQVTIRIYDYIYENNRSELKPVMTWTFEGAYPIKYSGPHLKTGDQALAVEELEIAHHGFQVTAQ